jgi:hypothetical protein
MGWGSCLPAGFPASSIYISNESKGGTFSMDSLLLKKAQAAYKIEMVPISP